MSLKQIAFTAAVAAGTLAVVYRVDMLRKVIIGA